MKEIKGYEGLYAITSCGKVWSHRRKKFLKPVANGWGYLEVRLCVNGESKHRRINRLVAEAYIPNPDNKPFVNHIDENILNNNVNNLEWTTARENNIYGTRIERARKVEKTKIRCVETG